MLHGVRLVTMRRDGPCAPRRCVVDVSCDETPCDGSGAIARRRAESMPAPSLVRYNLFMNKRAKKRRQEAIRKESLERAKPSQNPTPHFHQAIETAIRIS